MSKEQAFSVDRVSPHPIRAGEGRSRESAVDRGVGLLVHQPAEADGGDQPSEKSEKTREKRRRKTG